MPAADQPPIDRVSDHDPRSARAIRTQVDSLRAENAALAAEVAELRTGYRAIKGYSRLRESGVREATSFTIDTLGPDRARAARLRTPSGDIVTPAYIPVAPRGAIAGITPAELTRLGAQGIGVDIHELFLQPGPAVIEQAGGIGAAMAWPAPTFGDTGAVALAHQRATRISDDGITFRNRLNGSPHWFDPEETVRIAHRIGVDVLFALADPGSASAKRRTAERTRTAIARTERWARRALAEHAWQSVDRLDARSLWAVVVGGEDVEGRQAAARAINRLSEYDRRSGGLGFGGYRIDGIDDIAGRGELVRAMTIELDEDRPRYLPRVSSADDVLTAIEAGIDIIDGTAAAEAGARGAVFTSSGMLDLTDPALRSDFRPIDPKAERNGSANRADEFTRAYIHHLFVANEGLAATLCTLHNEHFFASLTTDARNAIRNGGYSEFAISIRRAMGKV